MKPRHQRAALIAGGLASIGLAAYFVLTAFENSLVFFFTPSQVAQGKAPHHRAFRLGGVVKGGTVQRQDLTVSFVMTDTIHEVRVTYTGILPDLFREGKGAVVQGQFNGAGTFTASEVLAKHDENYEAQHALDQARIDTMGKTLK
jgi:cytochrome c-type biogenesis protein CcmE